MRCAIPVVAAALVVLATSGAAAQSYKGLDLKVAGIERATNVGLSDCPPGQNSQRGVIKPGDSNEFASVKVDFTVTAGFKPATLPKPTVQDESGKTYNTAQSFAEIGATPTFSCTFSFRVPKGTRLARFTLDTLNIDLRGVGQ